jgi:hypothetical protein
MFINGVTAQTTFAAPSLKLWSVNAKATAVKGRNGTHHLRQGYGGQRA